MIQSLGLDLIGKVLGLILDTCEWGNDNRFDTAEQQHDSYNNSITTNTSEDIVVFRTIIHTNLCRNNVQATLLSRRSVSSFNSLMYM